MSFFKRIKNKLTPPEANVVVNLDKEFFALGETVTGTLTVNSREDFTATEVRCEVNCTEEAKRRRRVYDERLRCDIEKEVWETAILYSAKPTIKSSMTMYNGYSEKFPFTVNIPAAGRPTYKSVENKVAWLIKGVIAVDGRPDVTSKIIELQVVEPSKAQAVALVPREVPMIQCEYCKGLMPRTEIRCPNCGAKRTACFNIHSD
ncbi:MAG: hypothetical protein QXM22_03675 [Candidatus Bathyarchaeia archaeon]